MKSSTTWTGWVGSMALAVALGGGPGCGEMRPAGQAGVGEDEEVTTTRSALVPSEFWDGTGTIVIRVKPCDPVSSQGSGGVYNACAYCIMEPDWARVGGGAEISGEATPGAQLVASRPDRFIFGLPDACPVGETLPPGQESDVWIAKSRGIVSHQVRAYAIGMKIKDANGALVKPEIDFVVDSSSGFVGSPAIASTTSVVVPGWITTGGGAEVIPPTANAYLIESAPVNTANGVAWRARARYASGTPDGGVKTWVVALKACPSAWNGECFASTISIREAIASATGGYGTASYTLPSSWVTPVVGGKASSGGGGGRYLADLIPLNGSNRGAVVRSKPGPVADSGTTHAFALAIGRDRAAYLYNSVRFVQNGYSLYRPSGSNPKLQQSPNAGDASATRWHLEHLGSGVYRIRNGNPDSGSACAYRVSGTTTVRVTTCGSGNEFKWTEYSGTIKAGTFQLKNASSSTPSLCLDNNGLAGTNPSDLLLKTCTAFSSAQRLFLDVYNWPPP